MQFCVYKFEKHFMTKQMNLLLVGLTAFKFMWFCNFDIKKKGKDYIYIENDTDLFDACQDLNLKRILILNDFDQLEKYGQPVQMRINDSFRAEHITEIIKAISTSNHCKSLLYLI